MDGEVVEPTSAQALERPREDASSWARRLAALLPGIGAALLVAALGLSHGGYFATAWGPLTLAFLGVAAVALYVQPRPALSLRVLALPTLLTALAAWALASSAWGSPTEAVPEAQRALAYAAGALAFALVLRLDRVEGFLVGVWGGICIVCLDALAGRLFPERFGEYDPVSIYRLTEPVGYWNALGVLAAFGVLLAFGLVARAEILLVRLAAAASIVPLALTIYFTFSRGAWISLAAGLLFALILDPRRLQAAATILVVAPWPALAVWLASSSAPLTETGHPLASASADGHQLAAVGVGLALAAAGAAAFLSVVGSGARLSHRMSRAGNVALVAAFVTMVVVAIVSLGGPARIWSSFIADPQGTGGHLNQRLFSLSGGGREDGWRVALDQAAEHRLLGAGGGSYERFWLAERPYELPIRDAHSLYLETLAEYGPLGLVLILAVLAVPLGVAVRLRRQPLVPVAAGVLAMYAVHASIDWDWEFPVLTLVALAGASAIVSSGEARPPAQRFERRRLALLGVALILVPIVAVGALGSRAEASSTDAYAARDYERAADAARTAERLAPWSVEPLLLLGRAQAASGDHAAARETFRRALRDEPGRWRLWYELAAVSRGPQRTAALREARALNPLESLLDDLAEGP
jgi:O-antigen ligase